MKTHVITPNLKLIGLLRDVMVDATGKIRGSDGIEDIPSAMADRLRFSKREDWFLFGSCLYTFEDAEMAIRGYFSTAGGGHEKDFEYLRLFGFLNATYLQLGALDALCGITKIENKKQVINKLKDHEMIRYRNMLASHTVRCKAEDSIWSITIEQVSLGGTGAVFWVNEIDERRTCSFGSTFVDWAEDTGLVLRAIAEKFIGTVFKTAIEKKTEYLNRLTCIPQVK